MAQESPQRLSLAYRDLTEIHERIVEKFGPFITELDLSNNSISDLTPLKGFIKLQTLVLDNNEITSHSKIPNLPELHTLWVNKNKISNLSLFIEKVAIACPNLRFLSMLNNEACPNYFNSGTLKQYQDYRQFVISRLKNIKTLDSEEIASQEVNKASEVYGVLPTRVEKDVLNKIPTPTNLEKKSKSEKKSKRSVLRI